MKEHVCDEGCIELCRRPTPGGPCLLPPGHEGDCLADLRDGPPASRRPLPSTCPAQSPSDVLADAVHAQRELLHELGDLRRLIIFLLFELVGAHRRDSTARRLGELDRRLGWRRRSRAWLLWLFELDRLDEPLTRAAIEQITRWYGEGYQPEEKAKAGPGEQAPQSQVVKVLDGSEQ